MLKMLPLRTAIFAAALALLMPLLLIMPAAQANDLNPLWHGTWKSGAGGTTLKIDAKHFGDCLWASDAATIGSVKKKGCWAVYLGTKNTEELVSPKGAILPKESQDIATKVSKATIFKSVVITNTNASGAEQAAGECSVSYFYDQNRVYGRSLCKAGAQTTLYLDRYEKQ